MQGQGGGAPVWFVAAHWVLRLWGFLGSTDQVQPPPVFCPACAIDQSEMVATCAGLGDSQAKPNCESRLAAASAMHGATLQEVRGLGAH